MEVHISGLFPAFIAKLLQVNHVTNTSPSHARLGHSHCQTKMKLPSMLAFGIIALGCLEVEAQTLTKQQVKDIAELVLKREHQVNIPITKFVYNKETDVWTCDQVDLVAPDLDIRVEVRDKDRYYRRIYGYTINPSDNKFRMSPDLRMEILKIAPIKKNS